MKGMCLPAAPPLSKREINLGDTPQTPGKGAAPLCTPPARGIEAKRDEWLDLVCCPAPPPWKAEAIRYIRAYKQ